VVEGEAPKLPCSQRHRPAAARYRSLLRRLEIARKTLFKAKNFIRPVITTPWICAIQCVPVWQGCLRNYKSEYLTFAASFKFKHITIALWKRIFLERQIGTPGAIRVSDGLHVPFIVPDETFNLTDAICVLNDQNLRDIRRLAKMIGDIRPLRIWNSTG